MRLRPFFSYYGSKWRIADRYPLPLFDDITEPFAGSAGYSLHYPHLRVHLYDADPIICGVWRYLLRASSAEILALPDIAHDQSVDDIPIHQEARWLIGFWLNKGAPQPRKRPSAWVRKGTRPNSTWGAAVRERIASQLQAIRHWRIEQVDSYETGCVDWPCTWFIDPPYQGAAGRHYTHSQINFADLGTWCQRRSGQIIVCENEGADWLPFSPLVAAKSTHGVSREAVWIRASSREI